MKAKEFRKTYLGLQYDQINTLTPYAIDEMLEAYAKHIIEETLTPFKCWEEILNNNRCKSVCSRVDCHKLNN